MADIDDRYKRTEFAPDHELIRRMTTERKPSGVLGARNELLRRGWTQGDIDEYIERLGE